jgi:hypothetical protein
MVVTVIGWFHMEWPFCAHFLSVSLIPVFWIRWPSQNRDELLLQAIGSCPLLRSKVSSLLGKSKCTFSRQNGTDSFCDLVSSTTGMESRRVQLQREEPRRLFLLIWLIAWWLSGISSKNAAFRRALSISSSSHLVKIQSLLTSPTGTLGKIGAFQGIKILVSLLNNISQLFSCF